MPDKIVQLNKEVIKGQIKEGFVTKSLARGMAVKSDGR